MRPRLLLLIVLVCVCWVSAPHSGVAGGHGTQDKPFVVVVNNAPPFRIIEEWGGKTGYVGAYIDTIQELSLRLDIPLTFVNVPFTRALKMMETGAADMMLGPNWSVERAEYMVYLSGAFPAETKAFYIRTNDSDISRYSDLQGKTIGVLRSARYFDAFDQDESLNKVTLNDYQNGFIMLERRRIDTLIIPERQGKYMLKDLGLSFKTATFRVPGKPSFVTISRSSKLLEKQSEIEAVMTELNAEGFFERLMLTYLE